jgi:LCP family protein required for cell wall assembly
MRPFIIVLIALGMISAILLAVGKPLAAWAARRAVGELPPGSFTVAVLCLDYSEKRSDVIRILSINSATGKAAMVKLYRDLEWQHDGNAYRLNTAWQFGGPEGTLRAIKEATGLDVDHFIAVRIPDAQKIVDALGGLRVDVPEINDTGWKYSAGVQTLSGKDVVRVFRTRKGIAGGDGSDIGRTNLQDRIFEALFTRLRGLSPTEMRRVAAALSDVQTDLSNRQRLQLALALKDSRIRSFAIPFEVFGPRLRAISERLPLWRAHIDAWLATSEDGEPIVEISDPQATQTRILVPHPASPEQKALAAYLACKRSASLVADPSVPGVTIVRGGKVQ